MPKFDKTAQAGADKHEPSARGASAKQDSSVQRKLEAAREKREAVLSKRQAQAELETQLASKNPAARLFAKAKVQGAATVKGVKDRPAVHLGAQVLLVFFGALGFGLGLSLGASAISSSNNPAVASDTSASSAEPGAAQALSLSEDKQAMMAQAAYLPNAPETATLEKSPIEVLASYQSLAIPDAVPDGEVVLPKISKVVYLRGENILAAPLKLYDPKPDTPSLAAAALNATPKLQIYLHAPNAVPAATVDRYVSALDGVGFEVARVGREPFRVSATHLRFYSEAAAPDAREVADSLGIEARDFSSPGSSSQRLEIWVQGRAVSAPQDDGLRDNFLSRLFSRLNQ